MKRPFFALITSFSLFSGSFILLGCDNPRNTDNICNNHPELCEDLHQDNWCRFEKGNLIRQRYLLKNTPNPSGKQIFDQLTFLENYSKCIELAAGVQHKVNVHRTNDRLRAFGISVQNLEELQASTKGSDDPYLAYYHWSKFDDNKALQVLLAAEQAGKIQDPELLSQLAVYYLRIDAAKAKHLYLDAMAKAGDQVKPDWLLGLATAARHLNDPESNYLFSRANLLLTGQTANESQMLALLSGDQTKAITLDEQAEKLTLLVKNGNFAGSPLERELHTDNAVHEEARSEAITHNGTQGEQ